jgi:Na+-transporting NADH:ubiquinone oxidoreductase subunit NqrD
MTELTEDLRIKELIILPYVNHILNLVLQNFIEVNKESAAYVGWIRTFQGIMGKKCSHSAISENVSEFLETH